MPLLPLPPLLASRDGPARATTDGPAAAALRLSARSLLLSLPPPARNRDCDDEARDDILLQAKLPYASSELARSTTQTQCRLTHKTEPTIEILSCGYAFSKARAVPTRARIAWSGSELNPSLPREPNAGGGRCVPVCAPATPQKGEDTARAPAEKNPLSCHQPMRKELNGLS